MNICGTMRPPCQLPFIERAAAERQVENPPDDDARDRTDEDSMISGGERTPEVVERERPRYAEGRREETDADAEADGDEQQSVEPSLLHDC
jgi:hypothetical protein